MSDPCCAFIKPDGSPCATRPLPDRPFCLFHDPDQADALAQARRKGGATPRRRVRRLPRLLDYYHVGELLSELLVDAVNQADPTDPRSLQAITSLARTLLKAVGTLADKHYLEEDDRTEPAPTADHLLRVYPPLPPDVDALLEADLHPVPVAPEPSATPPSPPLASLRSCPHSHTPAILPPSSDPSDSSGPSEPPPTALVTEQDPEQDPDRTRTGHSAVDGFGASLPPAGPPVLSLDPAARPPSHEPEPASHALSAAPVTMPPEVAATRTPEPLNAPPVDPSLVTETLAVLADIGPLLAPETAASLALWAERHRGPSHRSG